MATAIIEFNQIRTGFYNETDLYDFEKTLDTNLKCFLGTNLYKITSKKMEGTIEFEVLIEGSVHQHKLLILINSISISFQIDTFNQTGNEWVPGQAKKGLKTKDFNIIFPDIMTAVK